MQKKVITKTKIFATLPLAATFAIVSLISSDFAHGTEANTTFTANVKESLSVSITTPTSWATGDVDTFLRNKVNVSVVTNNSAGFTASMTTKAAHTNLINTSNNTYVLPTLASSTTRGNFPANYWGYSLNDTENGSSSSNYNPLVSMNDTPITLISSQNPSGSKDFYFGAKGNTALASGTYTGTVVISVVTGVIDDDTNPVTPVNPVVPSTDGTAYYYPTPTGNSSTGTTAYTYRNTAGSTTTTTTQVSSGDNRDVYNGYIPPQGESKSTYTNINSGPSLASVLATSAAFATSAALFFFILAKRRDEDEEENR